MRGEGASASSSRMNLWAPTRVIMAPRCPARRSVVRLGADELLGGYTRRRTKTKPSSPSNHPPEAGVL